MLLRGFARLVCLLSWTGTQRLGGFLGSVWFHLLRIRRRVVARNLSLALPERAREHRSIAREAYRNTAVSALELVRLRPLSPEEIAPLVIHEGLEHYEAALARGRGIIVVTAHTGNFDVLACAEAARGVPLAIVSRTFSHAGSNRFWMESRTRHGLTIFHEREEIRGILGWLRAGKVLGLVTDQRTRSSRGGVLSPFLGRSVWTTTAPARLALRTGAALLPVRSVRTEDGRHRVVVQPELEVRRADEPRSPQEITDEINRIVEDWVRELPGQWMWLHKRFKDEVDNRSDA